MERDLSNRLRYRNPSRGGEKTIPGNLPIWENNICLYIQPVFLGALCRKVQNIGRRQLFGT